MNSGIGSSDFLVRPELTINHNVASEAVPLSGAIVVTARARDGNTWGAPRQEGFLAGVPAADETNLVVSELMYRPIDADAAEIAEGYANRDLFEYIEVMNIGDDLIALVGSAFTAGIDFDFDAGTLATLETGERALAVRDIDAFTFRYGAAAAAKIAGTFANDTGLSNGGEQVVLTGPGGTIRDFTYNDKDPWPTAPDGDGYSLVLISPDSNPDHALASSWQSSAVIGGTPGGGGGQSFADWAAANGGVAAGDDGDSDGRDALLEFAQGTDPGTADGGGTLAAGIEEIQIEDTIADYLVVTFQKNLGSDGVTLAPELAAELENWTAAGSEMVLISESHQGDGTALVSYRSSMPLVGLPAEQFVRLRATLP
jgi:hypothetical protein